MRRKKAALLLVLALSFCVTLTGCQLIGMLTNLVGGLFGGGGGLGNLLGGLMGGLTGGGNAAANNQAPVQGLNYVAPADQNQATNQATGTGQRDQVKNEATPNVQNNNQQQTAPSNLNDGGAIWI